MNETDDREFFVVEKYLSDDFDKFVKDKSNKTILVGVDNKELTSKIKNNINFVYPYEKETITPQKTSVTKIVQSTTPVHYDNSNENISNADRGTTYHAIFEKLSLNESSEDEINSVMNNLKKSRMITAESLEQVSAEKILSCLEIPEFKDMTSKAEWIKKETEFYMLLGESENPKDKSTVQGIVDLLISINGELVLVDYKTGKLDLSSAKEKYSKQLELYSIAIEKTYNKKVSKKCILAVDMEKLFII